MRRIKHRCQTESPRHLQFRSSIYVDSWPQSLENRPYKGDAPNFCSIYYALMLMIARFFLACHSASIFFAACWRAFQTFQCQIAHPNNFLIPVHPSAKLFELEAQNASVLIWTSVLIPPASFYIRLVDPSWNAWSTHRLALTPASHSLRKTFSRTIRGSTATPCLA